MDDLVVDDEFTATIVDDKGTDRATAVSKSIPDALEQTTLGDDRETLLDITGLGHGDQTAVVTEVQDAVGLEHRAKHGLDNNRGRGVGDEAGLLLELAGEEVDTEVAVLAGLRGDRDADDLARTTLQDEDVANADEVAGDGDSLARGATVAGLDNADLLADAVAEAGRATLVSHDDLLPVVVVEGVHDAVSGTLNAAAEGVVVTLVVVVTHLGRGGSGSLGVAVLVDSGGLGLVGGTVVRDVDGLSRLVLDGVYGLVATVVRDVDFVGRRGPATVLSLGDVELVLDGLVVDLSGRSVTEVGITGKEVLVVEKTEKAYKQAKTKQREASPLIGRWSRDSSISQFSWGPNLHSGEISHKQTDKSTRKSTKTRIRRTYRSRVRSTSAARGCSSFG